MYQVILFSKQDQVEYVTSPRTLIECYEFMCWVLDRLNPHIETWELVAV